MVEFLHFDIQSTDSLLESPDGVFTIWTNVEDKSLIIAYGYKKRLKQSSNVPETEDLYKISAKKLEPRLYAETMKKLVSQWPILVVACCVDGDVVMFYLV